MLRWLSWLVLLLVFVVVLLVRAPARLLPMVLPEAQVSLQGLEGTLWHGRASRALFNTSAGPIQLGELEWRLSPASLLTLSPTIALESHWGDQNGAAEVTLRGRNDVVLRDVDMTIDAGLLQQLAPVAMDGRLALTASYLHLTDGLPVQAQGRLVWEQGAWNAPRARLPLGTYALDFAQPAATDPLRGTVLTLAGPVLASGGVELNGRQYSLDMHIEGETALDPMLTEALSLLARPDGESFHMQLNGAF